MRLGDQQGYDYHARFYTADHCGNHNAVRQYCFDCRPGGSKRGIYSRREVLVCLTDAGREVIDSIVRLKLTRMLELTARLSDEGISDMLEHVRVMRRVFSGTDEVR